MDLFWYYARTCYSHDICIIAHYDACLEILNSQLKYLPQLVACHAADNKLIIINHKQTCYT